MAKNKKAKAKEVKSDADSVLDDVLTSAVSQDQQEDGQALIDMLNEQAAEDAAQAETVAEAKEPVAEQSESAGEPEAKSPMSRWVDAVESGDEQAAIEAAQAHVASVAGLPEAFSNLTVEVKEAAPVSNVLQWKSQPCSAELENLLRHKAQHFAKINYGINVSLTDVSQELLNKCGSDYRFLREIEKLTRPQ